MSASRAADSVRLASYLSLGVTGTMMATAHSEAAVVAIDLTNLNGQNITGVNAGLSSGGIHSINSWLGIGTGRLELYNNFNFDDYRYWGLDGDDGLAFAVLASGRASPRNFGAGALIDSAASFSDRANRTAFRYQDGATPDTSPDFGAGSFMGFRFGAAGNYNYGYLEVTWDSATSNWQILSGAYESNVNAGILAGAGAPPAIPLPAASLLALMALGGNSFRRSRTRAA